jgi:hypothetical protein
MISATHVRGDPTAQIIITICNISWSTPFGACRSLEKNIVEMTLDF